MGAIVLNGADIDEYALVGAGALVTERQADRRALNRLPVRQPLRSPLRREFGGATDGHESRL
ncbi:hypothetical protein [Cohnella xylanilytica]